MENYCKPEMQQRPMMMAAGAADNATIAAFLITRPPIGFIGTCSVQMNATPEIADTHSAAALPPSELGPLEIC
jgi:hypothetical protein